LYPPFLSIFSGSSARHIILRDATHIYNVNIAFKK
jgi:hypothetical protein